MYSYSSYEFIDEAIYDVLCVCICVKVKEIMTHTQSMTDEENEININELLLGFFVSRWKKKESSRDMVSISMNGEVKKEATQTTHTRSGKAKN